MQNALPTVRILKNDDCFWWCFMMSCVDAFSNGYYWPSVSFRFYQNSGSRCLKFLFAVNKTRDVKVTSWHFWDPLGITSLPCSWWFSQSGLPYPVIGFAVWRVAVSQNPSIPCLAFCFGFWGLPCPLVMKYIMCCMLFVCKYGIMNHHQWSKPVLLIYWRGITVQ